MTKAEVLTLINDEIVTNGNNEITAAVLNPVLAAIVNQINDLVGNAANLPIGETNVIDALSSITPQNIQIHTGTADPNITPPGSFNVGDFYSQTLSSVIFAFWQYNGIKWVEVLSRQEQKIRNTRYVTSSASLNDTDDVIIYKGTSISDVITLPDPALNNGRVIILVNNSIYDIQTNISYRAPAGTTTRFDAATVVSIISDGTIYIQINTFDTI